MILARDCVAVEPNMASFIKNDLVEMLGKQKSRTTFVPKYLSGKTTDVDFQQIAEAITATTEITMVAITHCCQKTDVMCNNNM